MKTLPIISLGLLLLLLQISKSERILFLLPIASKSHVHVFEPLIRALGERGHDVISLSPVKSPQMPSTVKQVQIMTVEEIFGEMANPFEMRRLGMLRSMVNGSFNNVRDACAKLLKTETFKNIVTNEKFDLVIVNVLINYCVVGAVPLFQAPSIMLSTFAAPAFLSNDLGSRLPPSFVADSFLDLTHKMNFVQRLTNVILGSFIMQFVLDYIFIVTSEKLYRERLPNGKNLPGIHEIQANTSMLFMNSHFTLTYPRPLLPDCIEVGGMHTRPAKALPKDIDDFLTASGDSGFIFFSLGSIVPANVMPEEYRQAFVRVFSRLKQRVIWKWETEMSDVPSNVMLRKWLPQQDILGHPNIKLFMSHGGLLSTQEAAYHGVPVLGFPIFGDQDLNIRQAETTGYAKFFEILDLNEDKLENAIREMLKSKSYARKAKELSAIVRDLPHTPLEKAVYWSEYVIRHKGAPHLRSAARDLNFFQYYLLDVAMVIFLFTVTIIFLLYVTVKLIFRKICGKKNFILQNKTKVQ